ncbi:sulfoxide reductase heme-binding subunit YedZ [Roseomonas gilardii subsp. gilardii]|uniref:sulfite oxidase heme-binding subunit YedZ n=1 Tax=Roseomonas gilardii TaxID=257708 RepID=UPI001FF8D591|nr:protein-methionine-sulfoxide reductase heme-binding subunit MsrQ [Roseomonas gilardii]UPG73049.1 sulfoxide reductase heme-binding subunit YedZ [Roseomonas gilardii subsp. gilardii]
MPSDLSSGATRPRRPRAGGGPGGNRSGAARPGPWPWLDRGGRVSPFKTAVFLATLLPGLIAGLRWSTGTLGAEPYMEATHQTGLWAIRFLLISLAVTPLRHLLDWPGVVVLRRMLGLAALAYALAHLLLYVVDQRFDLLHVAGEILRRTYLTIGFAAVLGLCVLGWTSTDGAIRRMGRNWKRLHRLVFPIAALGALHFFMQSKVDVSEAVLMAGFLLWLILWRLLPATRRTGFLALLALVPLSALGAAAIEYGWYALATRVPAALVLRANLGIDHGPRPAQWVAVAALAAAVLPVLARLLRRFRPA